jgi:MFS transporter, MHS family, proline/betaine transporter
VVTAHAAAEAGWHFDIGARSWIQSVFHSSVPGNRSLAAGTREQPAVSVHPAKQISETAAAPEAVVRNLAILRRAVLSCTVGQMFEVYDFVIYGFMATALARVFFPGGDPLVGLLKAFGTFAVGFVVRPLGAVITGSYGDRHGRRQALVLTIMMMAVSTGITGLIPAYSTIGIAAPILLVLCRMFQGFSTGGQWGGAAAFLVEYAPPDRRGLISSFQQAATAIGMLLGTLIAALLTYGLPEHSFFSWGWRIPFLLGFVLGPVGHYLRTRVGETPVFTRSAAVRPLEGPPMREVMATQLGPCAASFGFSTVVCVLYWAFLVYVPTFAAQELHLSASATFFSTTLACTVYLILTPLVGAWSDRVGRKPLLYAGSLGAIVFAYPLFRLLVSYPTVMGLAVTQALAAAILTLTTGVLCAVLAESFPTKVRYTALAISYGASVAIFGGFAPLISAGLFRLTGSPEAPAYYVIFSGVFSLVATFFVREGAHRPLPE